MHLENIGQISQHCQYWHLVYDQCGPCPGVRAGSLERLEQAAREVRRYYAECLTCRLGKRQSDKMIHRVEWGEPPEHGQPK